MAPSSQRSRHIVEQRVAVRFVKHSPLLQRDTASISPTGTPPPSLVSTVTLSTTPSSASSASGPPGVTLPPHGVPALIGIIVTLSLAILGMLAFVLLSHLTIPPGFATWRVFAYRRDKKIARTAPSEKSSYPIDLYSSVDEDVKSKRSLSVGDSIAFPPKAGSKPVTRERTAAEITVNLGYHPKVIYAAPGETTTPSPGIKVTPAPGLQITPPPVYVSVPPPTLSPRTAASIAPSGKTSRRATFKQHRLVVVESTFTPTLRDELEVREGETLQLLEEYADEWCLVQRVGQKAVQRGVVPRFCVVDKRKSVK